MTNYFALEQSFWKQNEYRLRTSSQLRQIYEQLLSRMRSSSGIINEHQYWQRLSIAEGIIDHIASALRAFWLNAPMDVFWLPVAPHLAMISRPQCWSEASPVDEESLHDAADLYLRESWMQLNIIDWYILNGFIYDDLIKTSAAIAVLKRPQRLSRAARFPGACADDSGLKKRLEKIDGRIAAAVAILGLIPALLYFFSCAGFQTLVAWTLFPYAIGLAMYLLSLPKQFSAKTRMKDTGFLTKKQNRLLQLYQLVSTSAFTPSRISTLIMESERDGIHFDPVVYVIMENAVRRDPSLFRI